MKKLLMVEDNFIYLKGVVEAGRRDGVEVLEAPDLAEAKRLLEEHPDIDVIVWDAELPDGLSHKGTIQEVLARGFKGIMAANSSDGNHLKKQMEAGCTISVQSLRTSREMFQKLGLI